MGETGFPHEASSRALPGCEAMEAAGIEPASEAAPDRASTSLGSRCVSPDGRLGADQPPG